MVVRRRTVGYDPSSGTLGADPSDGEKGDRGCEEESS
jgi:hypothetical protein